MDATCKGCADRFPGCHDKCERYAQFRAELERVNAIRQKEVEAYFNRALWTPSTRKRVKGK